MMKILISIFLLPLALVAQTIEEKRASLLCPESSCEPFEKELYEVNEFLEEKRERLAILYEEGRELYENNAGPEDYVKLISEIRVVKCEIAEIEKMWRKEVSDGATYDLWQQPDVTLLELVMDYGSHEAIYFVPPEIAGLRVSLSSGIPIPRETWSECLRLVLEQNGIGVRELNPYLKELFFLSNDASRLFGITSNPADLEVFPPGERILFILSAGSEDPHALLYLLQKFSNPQVTSLEVIRGEIFIVSTVESLREILRIYDCIENDRRASTYELVTLSKLQANEIASILETAFPSGQDESSSPRLKLITFEERPRQLFLLGAKHEVDRAYKLITDIESKVEDASEKALFWYTAKHTKAEELAKILGQVYLALVEGRVTNTEEALSMGRAALSEELKAPQELMGKIADPLLVSPERVGFQEKAFTSVNDGKSPFIVDPTSGAIIMVVESAYLPRIKELLKKLDVPKKMVQLEVLLFEKKLTHQNKSGLNLLRIGDLASSASKIGGGFNGISGILEFVLSKGASGAVPAFDLVYKFLLNQEDIQINASPSVMTVNQTPAHIAIVEEISVNTGSEEKDKKSMQTFSRAQYGISIQITPTINTDEESEGSFITLDTDITFDTTKKSANDRPEVTRRHIKNHVRVADGETVILGGLRRKSTQDSSESIPFLGEIPGIGKLFSSTDMNDSSTEMFVFITPKVVADPTDAMKIKTQELSKRPGDIPSFLAELQKAKEKEKRRLFQGGLEMLFGRKKV